MAYSVRRRYSRTTTRRPSYRKKTTYKKRVSKYKKQYTKRKRVTRKKYGTVASRRAARIRKNPAYKGRRYRK